MTDLNEKLTQILNDPGSMQQIMDMAAALSGQSNAVPAATPETIRNALQQVRPPDPKQEALVRALLPYLRPSRQIRLERAIQVAQLSHLAGFALQTASSPPGEETDHDV